MNHENDVYEARSRNYNFRPDSMQNISFAEPTATAYSIR